MSIWEACFYFVLYLFIVWMLCRVMKTVRHEGGVVDKVDPLTEEEKREITESRGVLPVLGACPECGTELVCTGRGGGAKCPSENCGYWVFY